MRKILTLILVYIILSSINGISIGQTRITSERTYDLTLEDKLLFYMKLAHAPSLSACIIKNNTMVWAKAFGYADVKNSKPATENTIYMAGSISKTITATAFMQLYEKGYFGPVPYTH
ncbi:MAG TPA: class A beta-lactamase-related serine hydrolase, partial [Thermoplasmatales archaeon]|nr:class A beta-lactamase-related serine hydrolase [Thermoplasmatales archaeon]